MLMRERAREAIRYAVALRFTLYRQRLLRLMPPILQRRHVYASCLLSDAML